MERFITSSGASISLRQLLLADAALCGGAGIVMALGASPLADWLGMPSLLLRVSGLVLLLYAAVLAYLGTREHEDRRAIWAIAGLNLLWVLASIGLLVTGWVEPTALGYTFVIVQAVVVAIFVELYVTGLRQTRPARG
jgi:hypothetical protein